jgi:serine/threonine-protein kinase HipA
VRDALIVWWDDAKVGRLEPDGEGGFTFQYAPAWLEDASRPALSLSLPKQAERYPRRACRPFFAGLLPEEGQRRRAARLLGVSATNDFQLLDELGGDVAGALSFLPEAETPIAPPATGEGAQLSEEALAAVLEALPRQPLLIGEAGLRLSLAGAQAKVPVVRRGEGIALPKPGEPSTHILKPAIPDFADSVANEAFVMRLAARAGLDVAPIETGEAGGRPYLLVTRYDRTWDEGGQVRRLHQEDFCQALGIPPERKYAAEKGPAFPDCFALVRRASARPAVDVLKLLDAAIFNLIVGNADAHGKNFSLLHGGQGIRLAPLYDLLSTVQWPALSPRMAMPIGGARTIEELSAGAWERFAKACSLGLPLIRRRVRELANAIRAAGEGDDPLARSIHDRAGRALQPL